MEDKHNENKLPKVVCHRMPCTIKHNGPASVKNYFEPIIQDKGTHKTASFRGRPLMGKDVILNDLTSHKLTGLILATTSDDPDNIRYEVKGNFDSFTHWELDKDVNISKQYKDIKQWLEISSILHREE
ncbi:unnamed protein product [Gordionus sp. m RMFG-2023]